MQTSANGDVLTALPTNDTERGKGCQIPGITANVLQKPPLTLSASTKSLRVGSTQRFLNQRCESECSIGRLTTPCGQAVGTKSEATEYVGIFDVFKIGIGPSSSHTMGPMSAGKKFVETLSEKNMLRHVVRVEVNLYGSLALTGKGHATDKASVLGLAGYSPASINPDVADDDFSKIITEGILMLNGEKSVKFHLDEDLIFYKEIELPCHPNGMTIQAYGVPDEEGGDNLLLSETYYSIGGGFIRTEAEMIEELINKKEMDLPLLSTPKENISLSSLPRSPESSKMVYDTDPASPLSTVASPTDSTAPTIPVKPAHPTVPFFFKSAQELLQLCKANKMSIAEIMVKNECVLRNISTDEVYSRLDQIAAVIDCCVERGLRMEGTLPVSGIPRRSAQIRRHLQTNMERRLVDPLFISDWIALYARAVNEENACGGRVVTAPTNGAAGTLPAVLTYYRRSVPTANTQGVRDFLATGAAIGSLCKRNASISGAEAGCQAEVGSACAMAAAALCAVLGGSAPQIENAAEIGLEHCLGMTCDPIMGLVQIPCIERNCIASIKAITACRLAMVSDGQHEVSLDSCIETMYRTGLDMQAKYRETSTGGLSLFAKKMVDF